MKKLFASVLACAMVASMAVQSFAAPINGYLDDRDDETESGGVYQDIYGIGSSRNYAFERVRPDKTYWISVEDVLGGNAPTFTKGNASEQVDNLKTFVNQLSDKNLFKVTYDKDGSGKSLIKSISIVTEKNKDEDFNRSLNRTAWFKVTTNQTFDDSEKKAKIEVTIKPKKTARDKYDDGTWRAPDTTDVNTSTELNIDLTFWVQNYEADGEDYDAEAGAGFVFKAESNEENTIVYGDDRAALYFNADDDADKFYAKLSTSANWSIINEYGDPADADLWFYDFVGNRTIPSTSRATLTLGIPWDEDDNWVPNPEDCYLYRINADGSLTDITSTFTFDEDNDTTTGIAGWTIKTRTLGTYVLSDIALDIE